MHQLERLEAAGLIEQPQEIVEISHRQTMALRKAVLKKTRANESVSGYVITCISDQPISTSGVLDDLQRLKFRPEEMRAINDDDVLLLDWDRARSWTNGGDRPHPYDRYNHRSGAQLHAHLILDGSGRGKRPRDPPLRQVATRRRLRRGSGCRRGC